MPRSKIKIDKQILKEMYIDKNFTPQKIGDIFGCNVITVRNRIKEHGIKFKDPSFARIRYKRVDFDNDKNLKAYMLGFRIGDLNVYSPSTKSQTIVVRCHSTQVEQINVIKSLFQKYGKVTVSNNKGHYHINCFLNQTFDFLAPKDSSILLWLHRENAYIPSFIAGYVDAEANFILNQGRARFKIDSYDLYILEFITNWLRLNDFNFRFRRIYKVGDEWNGRSPLNKDLWRLNINDMVSLQKFIKLLLPLIRHSKRRKDMIICLKNIDKRMKKNGNKKN